MKLYRLVNLAINICLFITLILLLIGILYFINGSLEEYPTLEQQEKAKIAASAFIAFCGTVELILIAIKKILRKNKYPDE